MPPRRVQATAPGKAILFGEHSVNRGQSAIAVSVGLMAQCEITADQAPGFRFQSGGERAAVSRDQILDLVRRVESFRAAEDYAAIQALAAADFFAPTQYIIGTALGDQLPEGMAISFHSDIPRSSGLGSGGAAFAALSRGLRHLFVHTVGQQEIGRWAHLGDIIAHGGIASALDTQTSLNGGAIRFTADGGARPIPYDLALTLVIGDTRVTAATSEVNGRVRRWLAERPSRMHFFEEIGLISSLAEEPLRKGDWNRLGQLMNINHVLLQSIGVSCPEIEAIADAAREAGAFGAKLSGSGGGGIVVALTGPEGTENVAKAMRAAGAEVYIPPIGTRGTVSI